jgi:hypothetical protein
MNKLPNDDEYQPHRDMGHGVWTGFMLVWNPPPPIQPMGKERQTKLAFEDAHLLHHHIFSENARFPHLCCIDTVENIHTAGGSSK